MSAPGAEWISDRSRDNSPDGRNSLEAHDASSEKRTSKKRKVLSCYACRNRKMKCDRVYPVCGRCHKTGRADQCTYDPRLLEESYAGGGTDGDGGTSFTLAERHTGAHQPNNNSDALHWRLRTQERRIELLERQLAARKINRNPSQYEDVSSEEPDIKEEIMFRGKGFKTLFYGGTNVMSIVSQYQALQAFTREAFAIDHSILRVKADFKGFRDRRKEIKKAVDGRLHATDECIFAALPERHIMDAQITLYFQTFETAYRIIHEPSFWESYHNFWEQQFREKDQVSFAVMLVLVFATTKCLVPKDDAFFGDTSADRRAASDLIDICDSWISQQPRKRLALTFFQNMCLSLLAKRVNSVMLKQDWVNSGDLLRLALASGMHRDPSLRTTSKMSEFDMEMKKRLWVTIMEFELQSSIENGFQSALTGLYFDSPAPTNVPDDAFLPDSDQTPVNKPSEQFTPASYLIATLRSLPLRVHLTQLLNTPSSDLQYSDIMHFDAQLHAAISSLPCWDEDRAALPSALLRLQLRQYLLILHRPYARLAAKNERYMYSFTAVVDTCSTIISIHDNLMAKGIFALSNMRNDTIRVGLTLSQIVYESCIHQAVKSSVVPLSTDSQTHFADLPSTNRWGPIDPTLYFTSFPREPFLIRTLCTSSIDILERARQNFEQKVLRLGTGYMEFWLMAAALGMLPPQPSPATSIAYVTNAHDDILSRCRKTLDHFLTLAYRVLAMQKDPENSFALSLRTTLASVSRSTSRVSSVRTPSMSAGVFGADDRIGATPAHQSFEPMNGMGMGIAEGTKDMGGAFDALQDMQVDLSEWAFPNFWVFDLGGEF